MTIVMCDTSKATETGKQILSVYSHTNSSSNFNSNFTSSSSHNSNSNAVLFQQFQSPLSQIPMSPPSPSLPWVVKETIIYTIIFSRSSVCIPSPLFYRVVSLCMSPKNDTFMSGSLDHSVRLWDLRTNICQVPHTYTHTYIYMHNHNYIHAYIHTFIIYICVHTHTHTHTHTHPMTNHDACHTPQSRPSILSTVLSISES